ncbi:unnamed protein product [Peronospora farinosa]|uniref:Terpenoid synthase n=1 Tax=Peronospora farinosa TaxID=134698 RepID=A0AAV0UUT0_9STRA|nr:unnamed protein product [Peronospora farinosa]
MKISGLRYTDVCAKARRLFESGRDHDHVVSFFIGALLPLPKCSDEDTTLFLLTTLYYVIDFLDGLAVSKDVTIKKNSPDEASINMFCFDSPNNVLSMIRVVLEADNDNTHGLCDDSSQ